MTTATKPKRKDTRKLYPVKGHPSVYTRSPGKPKPPYIVRWRETGGRERKQSFATLELADQHVGKLRSGLTSKRPESRETVGQYFDWWKDNYRGRTTRGLEASTRDGYKTSFKYQMEDYPITRMRLRDVLSPDISAWLYEMEAAGESVSTIKRAKRFASVLFGTAKQEGRITTNPVEGVAYAPSDEVREREEAKPKPKPMTRALAVATLNSMTGVWRMFFLFQAHTGVRIGELLGLRWENVHLGDDPHVRIVEQVYRGRRKRLKTDDSEGRVPLSPGMASWLGELRPKDADDDAPVFPTEVGTPQNYGNVYHRVIRPALIEAGVARQTGIDDKGKPTWSLDGRATHHFRHACGSLLLEMGDKTPRQVQDWLRHAQLTTTMNVYIDKVDDGKGTADVMDDIFKDVEIDLDADPVKWGHCGATRGWQNTANGQDRKHHGNR